MSTILYLPETIANYDAKFTTYLKLSKTIIIYLNQVWIRHIIYHYLDVLFMVT